MDVNVMTETNRFRDLIARAQRDGASVDRIRVGSAEVWAAFVAATGIPLYRSEAAIPGVGTLLGVPIVVDRILPANMMMLGTERLVLHRESDDTWLTADLTEMIRFTSPPG